MRTERLQGPQILSLGPVKLCCIMGIEAGLEHVSVHAKYRTATGKWKMRTPTWDEMCRVKDFFWEDEEEVVQIHPRKSEYVNMHPHVLHLWRSHDGKTLTEAMNP